MTHFGCKKEYCRAESAASDTAALALRGFTYQAIGQLAKRAPSPFQKNTDIAAQMFSALSVEPPGVRAALQEAVSTLSSAYKGCSGNTAASHVMPAASADATAAMMHEVTAALQEAVSTLSSAHKGCSGNTAACHVMPAASADAACCYFARCDSSFASGCQ